MSLTRLSLVVLSFYCASLYAEEGKVTFEALPSTYYSELLAGLETGSSVDVPSKLQAPSDIEREVWRGNDSQIIATLNEVEMYFVSRDEGVKGNDFRIKAEFGTDQFVLKSSRSGLYNPEGGVVLRGGERKVVPLKTLPDPRARMVIAAPLIKPEGNFAVFLCPRFVEDVNDPDSGLSHPVLLDAKMRISKVHLDKVVGEISVKMLSGRGPGKLVADILTTGNLPRSSEFHDQVIAQDPETSLRYLPTTPIEASPFSVNVTAGTPLLEGLRVRVEQQTFAGYLRTDQVDRVVVIDEIDIKAPIESSSKVDNQSASCYVLLNFALKAGSYGKKQFELPGEFKGEGKE